MNNKLLIALPAAVVIGGIALYAWHPWRSEDTNRIVLSGNIEMTQVDIAFKIPGKLIERNFDEGDAVPKGAVVARLDRESLLRQRDQAEAALSVAEAQLAQAKTGVVVQRETSEAEIEQRKADLGGQQARLLELKNGSRPQEINEAKAAVKSADAEYERARRDWERAEVLHKSDDISTQQYDQARQHMTSAEAALNQTKQRLALASEGPRQEVIEQAASQVQRARAGLRMSEASALDIKRREQEVTARRAELARLRAQIGVVDSQLEDTIATAPVSGIVLVKSANPGEVLATGSTVLTIGDVEHPWLRGYVREADLGRVKLGMPVKVTTDSYPGKVYDGKLTFISSDAEFTPKQIQTTEERVKLVYRVKIDIDNRDHELKSNMPADAEIVLKGQ
jgi:HlyD family secretion protein